MIEAYFRELPEPITTFALRKEFMRAAKRHYSLDKRLGCLCMAMRQLPRENYALLSFMLKFLKKDHSDDDE